jgi:hypothetical protein
MNNALIAADFSRRANDILLLIELERGRLGLHEAINLVVERFVEDENHPELKRLGEVMALARRQAVIQEQLDDDREALHHGGLNHEELTERGHHYEMLRHQACSYNHLLRGLIESCGQNFSRDDLMDWLSTASSGRSEWARGEITGAASEVALHAALQGLPELRGLRYGSVEEDLKGYDFVGEWQGALLTIDAKTGYYPPLSEIKHGHRHLEISVPREATKDLQINHRGLARVRGEVRQVLRNDVGVELHASHHYFQPAMA